MAVYHFLRPVKFPRTDKFLFLLLTNPLCFIIIRKDAAGYLIDILEPHDQTRTDNLPKAIGLAKYAARNPGAGRIQLIHMNGGALRRLDLSRSQVRDRVLIASSDHDLNNVFTSYME